MTIRINSNIAFNRATNQLNQVERDTLIKRSGYPRDWASIPAVTMWAA